MSHLQASCLRTALKFAKQGVPIVIVRPRSKKPLKMGGVHSATLDRQSIRADFAKYPHLNYGLATGFKSGIMVVDVDGPKGRKSLRDLQAEHGKLPRTVTVRTARGRHYYFRCAGQRVRSSASSLGECLDVRGDGGYAVGPGSRHPSGKRYEFVEGRALADVEIAKAPKWLLKLVIKPENSHSETACISIPTSERERLKAYAEAARDRELDRLAKAPVHQRNNCLNVAAFRIGQFMPYQVLDQDAAEGELRKIALQIGLEAEETAATIQSGIRAGAASPRRIPFLQDQPQASARNSEPPKRSLTEKLSRLGDTDTDNAQRLVARWGQKILYCRARGWLVYDGKRFRPGADLEIMELAKRTARLIKNEVRYLDYDKKRSSRRKHSHASLSKGALDRMIDLAKSLVPIEEDKLDADPWLLNTITGTIDLRTGRRFKHDPRDLLTKLAPVRAERHAQCPTFEKFLRQITGGDRDLEDYIQRCLGYTLTGDTREQVFFFCHGPLGNNGKSTLLNLTRDMLGDYGRHTPTETLMAKQYDNAIPTDLARLAGVRMVIAIETNHNRQLDEAKIKAMTGGENVTARFMRQDFFEYRPEFKLWFAANDKPRVRGTDTALWRRIRVIPFDVRIPDEQIEKDLPAKLKQELPGILNWAVRGCLKWQEMGLKEPAAVRMASGKWLAEADHVKSFVHEMVISDPAHRLSSSTLFEEYQAWCRAHGELHHKQAQFNAVLQQSFDYTLKRTKRGSDWFGIKLRR